MFIDATERLITLRVLYAGPPGSSKLLTMRRLQESIPRRERPDLTIFHLENGRIASLKCRQRREPELLGCRVELQVVAVPDALLMTEATEELLLRAVDAIVFLPDRRSPEGIATQSELDRLCGRLKRLGRTSDDLPVFLQSYREEGTQRAPMRTRAPHGWPMRESFVVSGDTTNEVERVFGVVRDGVLDHVRSMASERGTESFLEQLNERQQLPSDLGNEEVLRPRPLSWNRVLAWALLAAAAGGAAAVAFWL